MSKAAFGIEDGVGTKTRVRITDKHAMLVSNVPPPIPPHNTPNDYRLYSENLDGMDVDGSSTPQEFSIVSSQEYDIHVMQLIVTISDTQVSLSKFGGIGALDNGIDILFHESGVDTYLIKGARTTGMVVQQSGMFDPYGSASSTYQISSFIGNSDAALIRMAASELVPGGFRLGRASNDNIKVIVNDDITNLDAFEVRFLGYKHFEV